MRAHMLWFPCKFYLFQISMRASKMIDLESVQDMPPWLIYLLKIFLDSSSRGEEAVLDLETRKKVISKKFRSDEKPAGVPAAPSNITFPKKKKNPARVSRWRLRLEQIKVRKEDKKWSSLAAEDITNQLVIQLDKKEDRQDRSERRPYQPHSSIRWKWEVPLWHCWVYLGQSQWLSSD